MKNKYNVGDKIRTRIHYQNDRRTEVEAMILNVESDTKNDNVKYKIEFAPEDYYAELGSTGCEGYINQDDIIEVLLEAAPSPKKEEKKLYYASGMSLVEGRWQSCGWPIEAESFAEAAQIAEADETFRIHSLSDSVVH